MERAPIFVAGLERSGTSLMFALLASHPNIAMTRRTNFWTHFHNQYGDLKEPTNFERCLSDMMRYKRVIRLKPDPDRIRREFWQGEPSYGRLYALLEEHYAEKIGKPRWGDKSLNTERYADAIFKAYPNAKFIHIIRDPRDRYASALTRWKVNRGGVGAGTAVWLSSVGMAKRHEQRYPENYMIVRYETLVRQPEETMLEICKFIDEAYTPLILKLDGVDRFRDEGGNSSYGQIKPGRISTDSIGRFRQVMTKGQIMFMQTLAKQDMLEYNYLMEPIKLTSKEQLIFASFEMPIELAHMVAWRTMQVYLDHKGRPVPSYRIIPEVSSIQPKA